jgi:hypothetical protein
MFECDGNMSMMVSRYKHGWKCVCGIIEGTINTLMMEAVSSSETSVNIYQITRRNIPEDNHLHTRRLSYQILSLDLSEIEIKLTENEQAARPRLELSTPRIEALECCFTPACPVQLRTLDILLNKIKETT